MNLFTLPRTLIVLAAGLACQAYGQTWSLTSAPTNGWYSVACSADGKRVAAVANPGLIYLSKDSGLSWMAVAAPSNTWYSIACSADGTNLIASGGGAVYTSPDLGASWTSNAVGWAAGPTTRTKVASSADGQVLLAAGKSIGVFTSTNAGSTWLSNSTVFPNSVWVGAACSANGSRMYAMQDGVLGVWISTSYGTSWNPAQVPNLQWEGLTVSALGEKLVGVVYQTGIYVSTNFGVTWKKGNAPPLNWQAVAGSADGTNLVATTGVLFTTSANHVGPIYLSTDGGASWTITDAPSNTWASVASSADGHFFVAVANGGGIYTFRTPASPVLNVSSASSEATLVWTVPSLDFRLQQSSDLTAAQWTEVTPVPVLNLTNLQNQVFVPITNFGARFFRFSFP